MNNANSLTEIQKKGKEDTWRGRERKESTWKSSCWERSMRIRPGTRSFNHKMRLSLLGVALFALQLQGNVCFENVAICYMTSLNEIYSLCFYIIKLNAEKQNIRIPFFFLLTTIPKGKILLIICGLLFIIIFLLTFDKHIKYLILYYH